MSNQINDLVTMLMHDIENTEGFTQQDIVLALDKVRKLETEEYIANGMSKREAQDRIEALERKVAQVAGEATDWKRKWLNTTNTERLHELVMEWCSNNDCSPDDEDDAVKVVEDAFDDFVEGLADKHPSLFGKERDWNVEVTVRLTGTISVRAKSRDEAEETAREELDNGDHLDDLRVDDIDIDDVEEDS